MSIAPIAATSLPWLLLELTEGKNQEPTEGTEPQRGNRNALALWLTVMVVAPIGANAFALVGSLSRKCPRMPKGVAVPLMVVIVVL